MPLDGLDAFNLTLDDAMALPRGVRRSIASYLLRFGDNREARDLLLRVVDDSPDLMQYRMWLVWAQLGCGELDDADRLSQELLAEFPENQRILVTRARVMLLQNRTDDARELFCRFTNDPDSSFTYWTYVGAASQAHGDWEQAGSALDRAVAIVRRLREENEDDYPPPADLWSAVVKQGEHTGGDVRAFREEIELIRVQAAGKIREELAAPRAAPRSSRRKTPPRAQLEEAPYAPEEVPDLEEVVPNPELETQLHRYFGFKKFRPGQQQVVEAVLDGKSVLAVMPTGGGKSLCYQLPAMLAQGVSVVVSPLIALMKDQLDGLPSSVQEHATIVNSTLEGEEITRRLREIRSGKYKLVYAAPERLRQRPFLHALRSRGVSLFVVDEAHCVSMWGHDFRPDYLFIGDALRYLGNPIVLGMTATATPQMRVEISNHFGRQLKLITTGTHRENLFLESAMLASAEEKLREVVKICQETDGTGIVYTRSRKKAEELARILKRERVRANYYHAGMDADERARVQEEFMDGRWRVICATIAFGMGIDKSDVRFVVHLSPPNSIESYYQEAGRAGRDGLTSRCVLLSTSSDKALITRWMREERIEAELPRRCYQIIREMTRDYAFAAVRADDLEREMEQDETRIRVAIGMLENVGLVKRHLDIPATATVTLTSKGLRERDTQFADFIEKAHLAVDERISFDTLEMSRSTGIEPDEIEERLLNWRDDGQLHYYGSGRIMLIERLPAQHNSKQLLEDMISKRAAIQELRVETVFRYAETRTCKHDLIARHFGDRPVRAALPAITVCLSVSRREESASRRARSKPAI